MIVAWRNVAILQPGFVLAHPNNMVPALQNKMGYCLVIIMPLCCCPIQRLDVITIAVPVYLF